MRHTGLVLPVGSMSIKESVHSGLNALFLLSTLIFWRAPFVPYFSLFLNFLRLTSIFLSFSAHSPVFLCSSLVCFSLFLHLSVSLFSLVCFSLSSSHSSVSLSPSPSHSSVSLFLRFTCLFLSFSISLVCFSVSLVCFSLSLSLVCFSLSLSLACFSLSPSHSPVSLFLRLTHQFFLFHLSVSLSSHLFYLPVSLFPSH